MMVNLCPANLHVIIAVLPDINLNSSMSSTTSASIHRDQGAIGALMASSLGRVTLGSLGFGKDLTEATDYRLPPVQGDSEGKLVQVGVVWGVLSFFTDHL